jgi:hypothetical protein
LFQYNDLIGTDDGTGQLAAIGAQKAGFPTPLPSEVPFVESREQPAAPGISPGASAARAP